MKKLTLTLNTLLITTLSVNPVLAIDNDHDGIDDARDHCPNTLQIKKLSSNFKYSLAVNPERLKLGSHTYQVDHNGCEPDNDGDGVRNSQDYCPDDTPQAITMGVATNGCPRQSDADGTPDYRDHCPNTPNGAKTDRYGCQVKA